MGKWIEAAGHNLASYADLIEKAQQVDGYFNIFFTPVEPHNRWRNLRDLHELYCAGHLMEGAVAYFQATGKLKLLDVLSRYADPIDRMFGPNEAQKRGYCGHSEIELALVKLYRVTDERRYLTLAMHFIDARGQPPHRSSKQSPTGFGQTASRARYGCGCAKPDARRQG